MDQFWTALITIVTGIIGLAVVAVLVSKNANTGSVITSATSGLSTDLAAAEAPVTGSSSIGDIASFSSLPSLDSGSGI